LSALFIALAVGGGFLLGLRVGLGIGHRNAKKKLDAGKRSKGDG
jgi:hypothetical protein